MLARNNGPIGKQKHCCSCETVELLWKSAYVFNGKICLLDDPTIPFMAILLASENYDHSTHTWQFITANHSSPNLETTQMFKNRTINIVWYIHSVKYSTIKTHWWLTRCHLCISKPLCCSKESKQKRENTTLLPLPWT